jgi:uncharacterized membrane protein YphA (DoxX/SURF4 family)
MPLVRLLARPMLASMFVMGGVDAVLHPDPKAQRAEDVGPPLARKLPIPLPEDPVQLVRINGAVQVVAGLMLATGRLPRVSALILAGSLAPTTYAGHRFWTEKDAQARTVQRLHFFKNISMLGGLLITAVDTGGKPSLAHRAGDAAHRVGHKVRS